MGTVLVVVIYPPGSDGGTVPTGTGFRHVTSDEEDSAAKLVENADVHASAAIAQSKIADLTTDLSGLATDISDVASDLSSHTHDGLVPTGGTTGQVLKKASDTNYDYAWDTDETSAGGAPDWGDITGTLSNQTDLQTALDGKSATSHNHAGVYEPAGVAAADITDSTVTGRALVTATDAAAGRTALTLGTIATQAANNVSISGGAVTGITDLAVADGGTGASTAQAAINTLTAVAGATNEHVLTKDTASGNAVFKAAPSGSGGPTLISSGAAPAAGAANSAAAPSETWLINTADNAVTTVETVMSVTSVPAGTYLFEYFIVWRSGATGTGTAFAVDYTGTVTRIRATRHYQSTGAAAATGVADGVSAVLTGALVEHHSTNADNGALGPNTGVGSTTEDQFDYIRGIMVVSDSATLNLTMTGEGNGGVTFKADSMLILKRLA